METQDIVEIWRREAIQEGRQEARQEVRKRLQKVLLRLLRQRFGNKVDARAKQRVAAASLEQIEAWTGRVLSATTLAKVFADSRA